MSKYHFSGWATKYDTLCSDGRTISNQAFKHCDDITVPLVWNHNYDGPESVIGKVLLKHNDAGVYAYGEFNNSATAETAKGLVVHGDITALSIYANKLKQNGGKVVYGDIKEVSLVLAGANPGASIQEVLVHGDADETAATIYNDETGLELDTEYQNEDLSHADSTDKTIQDVYNTMNDDQKKVVAIVAAQLLEEELNVINEEETNMKHNVFDQNNEGAELKHGEFMAAAIGDAKKHGSLKESCLAHAGTYGIENIEELFPDAHNISNEPMFIDRDQTWVDKFWNGVKKSPFSRLKAIYADITPDEARALGYTTGNLKKEEVFSLLKRTTAPTTIYKKQALDRDDVIDITDFEVVAWIKKEMRMKLNEELVRAMLIGDGRSALSEDKIKEANIRPIYNDSDLYTIKATLGTVGSLGKAHAFVKTVIKAMADYEGTGVPTLFADPYLIADMLLIEDAQGRFIYESEAMLAKVLRVKEIVPVPLMKDLTRAAGDGKTHNVMGIIVDPNDYTVGADKGGQVAMFDDFDIDYNRQKYLMETRCSGSLLKPKTAITVEEVI